MQTVLLALASTAAASPIYSYSPYAASYLPPAYTYAAAPVAYAAPVAAAAPAFPTLDAATSGRVLSALKLLQRGLENPDAAAFEFATAGKGLNAVDAAAFADALALISGTTGQAAGLLGSLPLAEAGAAGAAPLRSDDPATLLAEVSAFRQTFDRLHYVI